VGYGSDPNSYRTSKWNFKQQTYMYHRTSKYGNLYLIYLLYLSFRKVVTQYDKLYKKNYRVIESMIHTWLDQNMIDRKLYKILEDFLDAKQIMEQGEDISMTISSFDWNDFVNHTISIYGSSLIEHGQDKWISSITGELEDFEYNNHEKYVSQYTFHAIIIDQELRILLPCTYEQFRKYYPDIKNIESAIIKRLK